MGCMKRWVRLPLARPSMLTSVHILIGAAIGKTTGNIYLAAILSFFIHYLLDFVPHYNSKPVKGYLEHGLSGITKLDLFIKSIEPALGLGIGLYFVFGNHINLGLPIFIGGFFGWLPDLLVLLDWKFKIGTDSFIRRIDKRFHRHTTLLRGTWAQILIIGLSLFVLLK